MRDAASLQITAVALQGGSEHEHITHVQWEAASSAGIVSIEALIAWLREDAAHEAWLTDGEQRVAVEVVTPIGLSSHIRSRSEGQWGDHLLGLPRL
jgi:hypothetical protein